MVSLFKAKIETEVTSSRLVQSLNSPFFPPPMGSEGGWAKSESIITCMRMLRTPPFPPSPQIGGNPYLEVLSRFGLWRDFLNNGRRMSAGSRKVFWKPWSSPLSSVVSPIPPKVNNWRLFIPSLLEKTYL